MSAIQNDYRSWMWEYIVFCCIFLFYPFAVFLFAIFYIDKKWARIVFLLFTVLYGYNITAGDNKGLDLYRYLLALKDVNQLPFNDIIKVITGEMKIFGTDNADLYRTLMMFFVSRFTNNGHILIAAFSLVYGLLYLFCLKIFLRIGFQKDLVSYLLLLCFSVSWGLSGIAFVRFPTASLLFFIATYYIFENPSNKSYWLLLTCALFVHFGLLLAVFMVLFFFMIKENKYIIYSLLMISIIIPEIFSTQIPILGSYFWGTLRGRIDMYTKDSYIASTLESREKLYWYISLIFKFVKYYAYIIIMFFVVYSRRLNIDKHTYRLFLFSVMILSASNITMNIPAFGDRYLNLYALFLTLVVYKIYMLNKGNTIVYYLSLSCVLFFSLKILYDFRCILDYSTIELYTANLFTIIFDSSENSVWSLLK